MANKLEAAVSFSDWYEEAKKTAGGMVGSGHLEWPLDDNDRMGMQIGLLRAFAADREDVPSFCINFLYSDGNYDMMVGDVCDQIISPFVRDFRRLISAELSKDEPEFTVLGTQSNPSWKTWAAEHVALIVSTAITATVTAVVSIFLTRWLSG